ncbi:hypothetical protein CCMSSC00406_0001655 [Pleurotus cornucopiae]|uniref:Uncharacterized protein n=1 Tax=Pleurotus cornucopiae TaxID=5321 RepID=A0ACB7IMC9_PLECO|nr:hypothetical protein CCMSSC00406_0001655 [Pleurotus cornucopiae]
MPPFPNKGGSRRAFSATRAAPGVAGLLAGACLAAYFIYPDESRSAPTSQDAPLSPTHFTPATLLSSETCNHDTKLIKLNIPKHLIPVDGSLHGCRPIWSIFVKDDDIQVERPYTPLEGIDEEGNMLLWVKAYPKGEVGRWLHSKKPNEQIEIRGPLQTWLWNENEWDEVVMISGGTGITPFYQLFHSVIRPAGSTSGTRFTLLHSSRTPSDFPPPLMMRQLMDYAEQHSDRFRLGLFVDSDDGSAASRNTFREGRINLEAVRKYTEPDSPQNWWNRAFSSSKPTTSPQRRILFLVCGPEPMISAIAGPYGRNFSQGPVGGILAELGCTSAQVRKL